ncbi:MAG: hypothetical protein K0R38_4280 [Polyangiaceae bacterium]|jgi:hypothetical protein|nr:hypothetical protein [Polyangiaceae bacterium]
MAVWIGTINYEYHLMASRYTSAKQFAAPIEVGDPKTLGSARLTTPGGLAANGSSSWVTWTAALGNSESEQLPPHHHGEPLRCKLRTVVRLLSVAPDGVAGLLIGADYNENAGPTMRGNFRSFK